MVGSRAETCVATEPIPAATSFHDAARDFLRDLGDRRVATVSFVLDDESTVTLPSELSKALVRTLSAVAGGAGVPAPLPSRLTTGEAASHLGISRSTLLRLVESGDVIAVKEGAHYRFDRSEVIAVGARRMQERTAAFAALIRAEEQIGVIED